MAQTVDQRLDELEAFYVQLQAEGENARRTTAEALEHLRDLVRSLWIAFDGDDEMDLSAVTAFDEVTHAIDRLRLG